MCYSQLIVPPSTQTRDFALHSGNEIIFGLWVFSSFKLLVTQLQAALPTSFSIYWGTLTTKGFRITRVFNKPIITDLPYQATVFCLFVLFSSSSSFGGEEGKGDPLHSLYPYISIRHHQILPGSVSWRRNYREVKEQT